MNKKLKLSGKKILVSFLIVALLLTCSGYYELAVQASEAISNIDLNLNIQEDNDSSVEENTPEIVKELPEERTEYSTVYLNDDGSKTANFYSAPIRYKDDNNNLVDIDSSLIVLEGEKKSIGQSTYEYSSKATEVKTYYPSMISKENPILVSFEDYSVSLAPIENDADECKSKTDCIEAQKSEASVINEATVDLYTNEEIEKANKIQYSGTKDSKGNNVDIEYISLNDGLKENIIINSRTDTNTFSFWLEIQNAYPELTEYGAILFKDNKTKEEIGAIPAPYMTDSSEDTAYSTDVHYELAEAEGGYIVTVVVSEEYLNSKDRVYPITIDPSVTLKGNSAVRDVYIKSRYPNTNYYSSGTRLMPVGYGAERISRTLVKFPTLSSKINGKIITSAYFHAKEHDNSGGSRFCTVRLARIKSSWSSSSVTWNNRPSYSYINSDLETNTGTAWHSWDVRDLVGWWACGKYSNYGFLMRATVENVSNYDDYYGSRTGATSCRPYLSVTYQNPSTLSTPSVTSAGTNSGYSNMSLTFTEVSGASKYYLYITGTGGGSTISRNITNECVDNGSTRTWNSSGRTIFSGYTGFPNSSAGPLGGSGNYTFKVKAVNHYNIGVNSNSKTVALPDNTAPNAVSSVTINSVTRNATDPNTADIAVRFPKTTDLTAENGTGIKEYRAGLYYTNASNQVVRYGSRKVIASSSASTFSCTFTAVDCDLNNPVVKVRAYDVNNNYSALRSSSTIVIPDYESPSAPTVTINPSSWTNQTTIGVSWTGLTDNRSTGNGIQVFYRFATGSISNPNYLITEQYLATGESGTEDITVTNANDGEILIIVYGKDQAGNVGSIGYCTYYKDTTVPEITGISPANESSIANGSVAITGTISDENLSSWTLSYKKDGFPWIGAYEQVASGTSAIDNDEIAIVDASSFVVGAEYIFKFVATDAAGNEKVVSKHYYMVQNGFSELPIFQINPNPNSYWSIDTYNYIFIPAPESGQTLPQGNKALFIDGGYIDSYEINEDIQANLYTYPDGSEHNAVVRIIDSTGEEYYSSAVIKRDLFIYALQPQEELTVTGDAVLSSQGASLDISQGAAACGSVETIEKTISGKVASIKIEATDNIPANTSVSYYASINGSDYFEIANHSRMYVEQFPIQIQNNDTDNIVKVKIVMESADGAATPTVSALEVYSTQFTGNSNSVFTVNLVDAPSNITTKEEINYTTLIRWDPSATTALEGDVTYNVYRAEIPDGMTYNDISIENMELKQEGLTETYWYDYNLNYEKTFVYAVTANAVIKTGEPKRESALSALTEYSDATVVSDTEISKRLGLQNYWNYSSFDTVYGTGYVETSKGNFSYQVVDASISGPKLGLVMRRTYNSQSTSKTPMGYGWDFSFNTTLLKEYDENDPSVETAMLLKDGDGTIHRFEKDGNTYTTPKGIQMYLTENDNIYTIERYDGITYTFNSSNQILSMSDKTGDCITYAYDQARGNLVSVTSISGDSIQFSYTDDLLSYITLPDGQVVSYSYVSGNDYLECAFYEVSRYDPQTGQLGSTPEDVEQGYVYDGANMLISIEDKEPSFFTTPDIACGIGYDEAITPKAQQITFNNNEKISFAYSDVADGNGNYTTTVASKNASNEVVSQSQAVANEDGLTLQKADNDGNVVTLTYDDNYNLTSASFDNTFETIGTNGQLASSTQQVTYEYTYDSDNNLLTIEDPYGHITTYAYTDSYNPHKYTSITTPKNDTSSGVTYVTSSYAYDAQTGNLLSETDVTDKTMTYTYDNVHQFLMSTATDRFGETTTYTHDNDYRLVSAAQPENVETHILAYDDLSNPTLTQDGNGNYTSYMYNERGQIVKATNMQDTLQDTSDDTYEYTIYDQYGRKLKYVDANGNETHYDYDSINRVSNVAQMIGNQNFVTTHMSYTYEDVTIDGTLYENAYIVTQSITEENNKIVGKQYFDGRGNLIKEEKDGAYTLAFYDEAGNVIKTLDSTGVETRYLYDKYMNKVDVIVNPSTDDIVIEYEYDLLGNVVSQTDGEGNATDYVYDSLSRVTSVTQHKGAQDIETTHTYDQETAAGDIQNITTNPSGLQSITTFDALGRTISQKETGTEGSVTKTIEITYTYDDNGNMLTLEKNDGTTNWFEYDASNNLTEAVYEKNTQGNATHYTIYTYDDVGNRLSMQDYKDNNTTPVSETNYAYDGMSRVIQYVQDGEAVSYSYDGFSNVAQIAYRDATALDDQNTDLVALNYSYNDDNQLENITIEYLDANGSPLAEKLVAAYNYNAAGQITSQNVYRDFKNAADVANPGEYVQTAYTYNSLGLIENIAYKDSTDLSTVKESYAYEYDDRGYILSEDVINNYPATATDVAKEYVYDQLGRLTSASVTDNTQSSPTPVTTSYAYDDAGNRTLMTKDGVQTSYEFNILNQMTTSSQETEVNGTTDTIDTTFTYNANGDLTEEETITPLEDLEEEIDGFPNYYTIIGDLTQTTTKTYTYDKVGNMLESQAVSDIDGIIEHYKDSNGNLHDLEDPVIIGNDENEDPDDDYIVYKTKSGAYYYNGDGIRIKKDVVLTDGDDDDADNVTTLRKYYYTGDAVLFVADASNNKLIENILTPDGTTLLSARYEEDEQSGNLINGYYTFNNDIRGSVTNILNNSGALTTGYVYDEYGNQIKTGDEDFINEATYTGAVYDEESELYYMNARYYNANTGQFTSRDTYLGNVYNPQTHNLYSYTGNNPTSFVDPTGHAFFLVTALIGAVVGGAIGAYHSYKTTGKVTLKSVVKGALIGGAVGLTLGAGASLALTGGLAASTAGILGSSAVAAGTALVTAASQNGALQTAANTVARNAPTVEAIKSSIPNLAAEIINDIPKAIDVGTYNALNKGPLPDGIANTFRSGTYTKRIANEELTFYRAYGGKASKSGHFWTINKPQGPLQSVIDSALDQNWGNTATDIAEVKIPKGTIFYQGYAASQGRLVGGGVQIYMPEVEPSWLVK